VEVLCVQHLATLAVIVSVLFQQYLKTLPDLVELSFSGNPVCSMLNPGASITDHLHQLLPKLEVIDGVCFYGNHMYKLQDKGTWPQNLE